jgi:hypothetical protein
MYNRMTSFLYENKILSEAQNGFRKGKSIDTAVQSFIERIQETLVKLAHTIGIFIDLSKAYDVLKHKPLLEKLFHMVQEAPLTHGLCLICFAEDNVLRFAKVT